MTEPALPKNRVPHLFEEPSVKSLATVYAQAFLDSSSDVSVEERLDELKSFVQDVLDQQPAFEQLLNSPRVPRDEKIGLLERSVVAHASPDLARFLMVLAQRERLELVRPIYEVAVAEQERRLGQKRVLIRSAAPLSDEQFSQIRQHLSQVLSAEPVLHVEIDPSLLGGLIIQVGDTVYDSSLRNRLGQLQSRLRQRYVHEIQSGRDRFSYSEGS